MTACTAKLKPGNKPHVLNVLIDVANWTHQLPVNRKEQDMKHIARISRTHTPAKADDSSGAIFLQIWASVFTWILMMGLSQK